MLGVLTLWTSIFEGIKCKTQYSTQSADRAAISAISPIANPVDFVLWMLRVWSHRMPNRSGLFPGPVCPLAVGIHVGHVHPY